MTLLTRNRFLPSTASQCRRLVLPQVIVTPWLLRAVAQPPSMAALHSSPLAAYAQVVTDSAQLLEFVRHRRPLALAQAALPILSLNSQLG
jgi:hypothetical protein